MAELRNARSHNVKMWQEARNFNWSDIQMRGVFLFQG